MTTLIVIVELILILLALVLIVAVLMQEGQSQGLGAIGGGAETFFGKNKAKSFEGKLATITKFAAIAFIVLAIACTIMVSYHQNHATPDVPADDTAAVETVAPDATEAADAAAGDTDAE